MLGKCLLALAFAAIPSRGYAAETYRLGHWEMGLNPGVAIPVGATNDLMRSAITLQLTGGYQFHEYAAAGLELGWHFDHHMGGKTAGQIADDFDGDGLNDRAPFSSNVHQRILQLTPFIKVGQWMDVVSYKFRPYFLLGGGFYHVWTNSGLLTVAGHDDISGKNIGPIYKTLETSSNSYFGFSAGGGFDVQVDETAAIGFDLRFERIVKPYEDLEFLTPSLRISYLF